MDEAFLFLLNRYRGYFSKRNFLSFSTGTIAKSDKEQTKLTSH